jgi:hypothetical protein
MSKADDWTGLRERQPSAGSDTSESVERRRTRFELADVVIEVTGGAGKIAKNRYGKSGYHLPGFLSESENLKDLTLYLVSYNRAVHEIVAVPIPMRLPCPGTRAIDAEGHAVPCGVLHVDEGEFATKPHHTHACQVCGHVWRPAIVCTVGVQFLPGFKDDVSEPKRGFEHMDVEFKPPLDYDLLTGRIAGQKGMTKVYRNRITGERVELYSEDGGKNDHKTLRLTEEKFKKMFELDEVIVASRMNRDRNESADE